ncbi:MAG: DUF615 domain-containing protein [Gammaproteobacteria bacterium]|nr:DUF615 domain-containing protein [Gammaproteobacteria bacterium]
MSRDFDNHDTQRPSKSRQKRRAREQQALGESLIALSENSLANLALPGILLEAVLEAKRMTKHGALKRQSQYIGRIMRDIDPEPIKAALEELQGAQRESKAKDRAIEHWRDRLLTGGDEALGELVSEYPQIDRQHLRRLVRAARYEAEKNRPPKSSREIFRCLRAFMKAE